MLAVLLLSSLVLAAPSGSLLREPNLILPALPNCTYEQALADPAHLSPEPAQWAEGRWLRYRIPDPAPGRPVRITLGWNWETREHYDYQRPRNTVFEYDWSGTKFAGNLEKQLKKLEERLGEPEGRVGGDCPFRGIAFWGKTAGWIVLAGGEVAALIDRTAPAYGVDHCIVQSLEDLRAATSGALARGDVDLLRSLRPDLMAIAPFDTEVASLLQAVDRDLPILEALAMGTAPPALEALTAWRTQAATPDLGIPDAGGTSARRTAGHALLAEALRVEAIDLPRSCLLRDLAWQLLRGSTLEPRQVEKRYVDLEVELASGPVWSSRLKWLDDERAHGLGLPHPQGFEGAGRDLEAALLEPQGIERTVHVSRAIANFVRAILDEADKYPYGTAVLRDQARVIRKGEVNSQQVNGVVALLQLWADGPPPPEARLAYLHLTLPDPPFVQQDSEVLRAISSRAAEAEAEGRYATAAGLRILLFPDYAATAWTSDLLAEQGTASITASLAQVALAVIPVVDPSDPFYLLYNEARYFDRDHTAWRLERVGRLELGESFVAAQRRTPVVRIVRGDIHAPDGVRPSIFDSTETGIFDQTVTYTGNESGQAADARSALERDIFFLEREIANLRAIGTLSSSYTSTTGSVVGSSTHYSASGTATTSPQWQGYSRTTTFVDRSATERANALEVELRRMRAALVDLNSTPHEDQVHTRTDTWEARVPVQVQRWELPARREVWLVWDGGEVRHQQSGRYDLSYVRRPANPYLPAYDHWVGLDAVLVQLSLVMDRGLAEDDVLEMLEQATGPGMEAWIAAGASRGWTPEEQATERVWVKYWCSTSRDLPEGVPQWAPK